MAHLASCEWVLVDTPASIDTGVKLAAALHAPVHVPLYRLVTDAVPWDAQGSTAHQATRIEILASGQDEKIHPGDIVLVDHEDSGETSTT